MGLSDPDERVIRAVDGAMKWFDKAKIVGLRNTGTSMAVLMLIYMRLRILMQSRYGHAFMILTSASHTCVTVTECLIATSRKSVMNAARATAGSPTAPPNSIPYMRNGKANCANDMVKFI
jgi:hypothetical protein